MTYPRAHLIDRENPGFYHLISRCVRRAWLCGQDPVTGRSYDHRRQWIEDRLLKLASCFTVELYAYAVMSNHYHIVLFIDPKAPQALSVEEVARRWITICPPTRRGQVDWTQFEARVQALMEDGERLETCRRRLGDLSWYMRFMNEHIARRANAEDACKGRFWEGRFESNALLDERSAYGCMTYVDLNPIRAGMTTRLEDSQHTSVKRRIEEVQAGRVKLSESLRPLNAAPTDAPPRLEISLAGYLSLVDSTGRIVREDKAGAISAETISALDRLIDRGDEWLAFVCQFRDPHRRAFGSIEALRTLCDRLGQRWLKGMGQTRFRYHRRA